LIGIQTNRPDCICKWYWSHCQNTQEKISKLSLVSGTAHVLYHNRCLFLQTWCWKDTYLVKHSENVNRTAMRAVYPNIHTLIKSMLTTNCTTQTASVERTVY